MCRQTRFQAAYEGAAENLKLNSEIHDNYYLQKLEREMEKLEDEINSILSEIKIWVGLNSGEERCDEETWELGLNFCVWVL